MVIWMAKLRIVDPDFDDIKKRLSNIKPDKIELIVINKKDNINEFAIIYYLVNKLNYSLESLTPIDESNTKFLVYFKRKS